MYAYIRGKLMQANPLYAVVDVGGVGYKILIPVSSVADLTEVGSEVLLHTSFVTRETGQFLFGFLDSTQRDLFETLTTISGVGPKTALGIIGSFSIDEFHLAIQNNDAKAISRAPGIGKKTAERLIVDMRDKSFGSTLTTLTLSGDPEKQKVADAMRALVHLGYQQNVAQKALKKAIDEIADNATISELITESLKHV